MVKRRNSLNLSCAAVPLAPTTCPKKRKKGGYARHGLRARCQPVRNGFGAGWGAWERLPRAHFAYTPKWLKRLGVYSQIIISLLTNKPTFRQNLAKLAPKVASGHVYYRRGCARMVAAADRCCYRCCCTSRTTTIGCRVSLLQVSVLRAAVVLLQELRQASTAVSKRCCK